MSNFINILTGNPILSINTKTKRYNCSGTLVLGNLFNKKMLRGEQGPEVQLYLVSKRFFLKPVVQAGIGPAGVKRMTLTGIHNLFIVDEECVYTSRIGDTFIGSITTLDEDKCLDTAKQIGFCDILCFNKICDNSGDLVFSPAIYEAIAITKPKLIIMGWGRKARYFKFPVYDVPCVAIGQREHFLYDPDRNQLLKEAFDYDRYE